MRGALETLVKRTKGGKWIEDAPVPAAIAKAHGHYHIFALVPGKKLLVVLPFTAKGDLAKVKGVKAVNQTSQAGIVISLATPRNAFSGYEEVVDVPKSFKWMRFVVTPLREGGADVTLEMGDRSAEDAAKNAPIVEKQLAQVRTLAKIATLIGADVLPPMKVEVDHDILRVNTQVSQKGLNHILNLARTHFAKKAQEEKPNPNEAKEEEEKALAAGSASPTTSAAPTASASAAPSGSSSAGPARSATPRAIPTHLRIPLPRPKDP